MSNEMLGLHLQRLVNTQSVWSQRTFGADSIKGPVGPLRHLVKEAKEAIKAPDDLSEYADCFLLILDAARRAGFSVQELIAAGHRKQQVNILRMWPKLEPWIIKDAMWEPREERYVAFAYQGNKAAVGYGSNAPDAQAALSRSIRQLNDQPSFHVSGDTP